MKFKTSVLWRWYAGKDLPSQTVHLFLMGDGVHGEVFQKRFEQETVDQYEPGALSEHGPTMTLDFDEAQFLMDQLYDAGIKPAGMGPSLGELAAHQAHIDSLKKVIDQLMSLSHDGPPLVFDFGGKTVDPKEFLSKKG